jgi:N-acetylglucosamine kinase-like BadF-type ATPase
MRIAMAEGVPGVAASAVLPACCVVAVTENQSHFIVQMTEQHYQRVGGWDQAQSTLVTELLAVDAGGTSTRAIVLTDTGACIGFGTSGAGNPISSGPEHVAGQVTAAVASAMEQARIDRIDGPAVLAMAGSQASAPTDWIAPRLERAGVRGRLVFGSDLLATFCAGAWEPDGYAIVAGTGAAAIRVRGGRQEAVSDGIGWLLGDAGSGYWIGRRVARSVAAHLDGRGPATVLTTRLLDSLGIPADTSVLSPAGRPDALRLLLDAVYAGRPIDLARFAPLVFDVDEGDEVAAAIRAGARAALRAALGAVRSDDVRGPVVTGGGVLGRLGLDLTGLDGVGEVRRVSDGSAGAAILVLREHGIPVDAAVFERVRSSLDALR